MKICIIGKGFLGQRCHKAWPDSVLSDRRITSVNDVLDIIKEHQPDAILNAAGVVGKPNVDWCETHQTETIFGNTIMPLFIADACRQTNTYLLHMGTGCVYYGYAPDPLGWKESEFPNPVAVYTRSKYAADLGLSTYSGVGVARIRMPLDYIPSPGNLIDKLAAYPRVVDVINSITVVEDMIKAFRGLLEQRAEGIFHVTNPGAIRHQEILALYKELVDPSHFNEWISEVELVESGLAKKKRSNTILQSENLARYNISLREVHEAVRDTFVKYAELKKNH